MPQYHVTSPDGATYEVNAPDGASEQDAIAYVQNNVHQASSAEPPATDMTTMATRGMTAGLSDYVGAAGRYAGDLTGRGLRAMGANVNPQTDESYNDALKGVRAGNKQYQDQNPVRAYSSEIAGAFTSPLFRGAGQLADAAMNAGTRASPALAQSVAQGAGRFLGYGAQGAATGALAGAGMAEGQDGGLPSAGDLAKSTAIGAAGGTALGVAVPALAEGAAKLIGRTAASIAANAPKMSQEQIKAASQAAYKASEDAGVIVKPEAFQEFATALPGELKGYHPAVTDGAAKIVNMLQGEAQNGPLTLEKLDALRSVASGASIGRDANEARLAGNIVGKIDDFIEGLTPEKITGTPNGSPQAAIDSLKEARSLWKVNAKLKTIGDIVDTGENLNDPNWVRNQLRAIVRKPAKFNQFTADEQKLLISASRTGNLELLARMIPWRGAQMAAPHIAAKAQAVNIGALQNVIAGGGRVNLPPNLSPLASALLARGSGQLSGAGASSLMTGGSNQVP